jgi:hypothetical protein
MTPPIADSLVSGAASAKVMPEPSRPGAMVLCGLRWPGRGVISALAFKLANRRQLQDVAARQRSSRTRPELMERGCSMLARRARLGDSRPSLSAGP